MRASFSSNPGSRVIYLWMLVALVVAGPGSLLLRHFDPVAGDLLGMAAGLVALVLALVGLTRRTRSAPTPGQR